MGLDLTLIKSILLQTRLTKQSHLSTVKILAGRQMFASFKRNMQTMGTIVKLNLKKMRAHRH